ncbi:MAG: hypothetical protein JXB14_04570 [Candidatus Altiarchaeota archaeon]|nr:hypothetical protein [Candidatus Altiarchaeota archaeon]
MADHKETWGIRIKPNWRYGRKRPDNAYFTLSVGKFQKGDNQSEGQFITNEAIQDIIRQDRIKEGVEVGRVDVLLDHAAKQITTSGFHPLRNAPLLRRRGVASFADYRIGKLLEKSYPDYKFSPGNVITEPRKEHLLKQGWHYPFFPLPISKAVKLSRDYVAKGFKKRRAKRK